MAIQSSNNSFSTISNITFGSSELKDVWWNVSNIDLPMISLSSPEMSNRAGSAYKGAADTCSYSDLTVTFIMDKDWKTFDEVYSFFLEFKYKSLSELQGLMRKKLTLFILTS